MTKHLSLLVILSSFLISLSAFAQRTTVINERVQTTYVNRSSVDFAQWLRIHPSDLYETELRSIAIRGRSYGMNTGHIEIHLQGRRLARYSFGRVATQTPVSFPLGTRLVDVRISVIGEVFVESVSATIIERRFYPAPPPVPPRYPAPIPPRPPRHTPAPRPAPPRHEPAPRPAPPRYEPAPRPTPPRHTPAPRPGNPRNPGHGPRR